MLESRGKVPRPPKLKESPFFLELIFTKISQNAPQLAVGSFTYPESLAPTPGHAVYHALATTHPGAHLKVEPVAAVAPGHVLVLEPNGQPGEQWLGC